MAGRLPGAARVKSDDPRARRNAAAFAFNADNIVSGALEVDESGQITLQVDEDYGIEILSTGVALSLATDPGLEFATGELQIKVKANTGILVDSNGISIDLDTDPGLEFNSGKLRTKIKTDGGITRDSNGVSGTPSTETVAGSMKKLATIAALNQAITDPPTQAEVQAISDKVDELIAEMKTKNTMS